MRTALLLLGFNRLHHFATTMASLESNPEAHEHDLHVFLDGGPQACQEELLELVNESSFANVAVVRRASHWGIGRHLIDARRRLFDELGYDRLVLFEDDMVLQPDYVRTVLDLSDWSRKYCDVGTVMAFNLNVAPRAEQQACLNHVTVTNRHFWGYCITKQVWDEIKQVLYTYEDEFLRDIAYSDRPEIRIRFSFIAPWMKRGRVTRDGRRLVPDEQLARPFGRFQWNAPTSQDGITALALWVRGFSRLTTTVSHARYVGEKGLHFTPRTYKRFGFDKQQDFDFSGETRPGDFELVHGKPGFYR